MTLRLPRAGLAASQPGTVGLLFRQHARGTGVLVQCHNRYRPGSRVDKD